MSGERLAIHLITAGRLDYARVTLTSTLVNLNHDGPLHIHVSDDSDPDDYVNTLLDIARTLRPDAGLSVSRVNARSYGANYNAGTQYTHAVADRVLVLEDDWRCERPLNTAPIMAMLACEGHQSRDEFAWAVPPPDHLRARSVRLGYLGLQWPITAHVFKVNETLWLMLDPDSMEQCIPAGHPRIETVDYQRDVGLWNETVNPGMTELDWVQRPAARMGVTWPLSLVSLSNSVTGDMYSHIGESRSY